MRSLRFLWVILWTAFLLAGLWACSGSGTAPQPIVADPDAGVPDAAVPDAAVPDAAVPDADGDVIGDPDAGTTPVPDAPDPITVPDSGVQPPPGTLPGLTVIGAGVPFVDVTTDQGGNIWGVTVNAVYFFRAAGGDPIIYNQTSGLAQGQTTWTDIYWFGTPDNPSTQPVTFTAVAGGAAGQVFVGNIGFSGDRLDVDPATGAVVTVVGLAVTSLQQPNPDELAAQQQREVATWHAVVDLSGPGGGAAYFGGFHGTSALHGIAQTRTSGVCGCIDYEEHVHPFSADGNDVYGGDVHGLAVTPQGDLWMADRKAVYFMPLGSMGPDADFFQTVGVPGRPDGSVIDVFPGVDDWNYGIALDASGGIYVASLGNGLAYLAPGSYVATTWTSATALPTNDLTGVATDGNGDVWVTTRNAGVLRYTPALGAFTSYTTAGGLPTNRAKQVFVDRSSVSPTRRVLFATDSGIAIYAGP